MTVLETQNLSKRYGRITAVDNLSLSISSGGVHGILGPNGSGKTTTLSMVLGVVEPDKGTFRWFGEEPQARHRLRIGALWANPNMYPYLTAVQNLKVVCDIKGVPYSRIDESLKFVKLYDRRSSRYSGFSTGMKQRLQIASTLLNDPEVLILDEPTNGLDPQGIAEVRELIRELGQGNRTIILASHLLDEVEKVCTHVSILKQGKLMASGSVDELLGQKQTVELAAEDMGMLEHTLNEISATDALRKEGSVMIASMKKDMTTAQLNKLLFDRGIVLTHLVMRKTRLEEQFIELTR
ncbi:MAG: ABC transporter ATP-binding protein [Bacteroidia bacterium]